MTLREAERTSIEQFILTHTDKLSGRVLDIGCGQQPYRAIIEHAGGEYIGYDRPELPGSTVTEKIGEDWDLIEEDVDAAIMTQVWQYIPPWVLVPMLSKLASADWSLKDGGWFLCTGPTNWPVIETEDLWRTTAEGAKATLLAAGFRFVEVGPRHAVNCHGENWSCGWWAIARARS